MILFLKTILKLQLRLAYFLQMINIKNYYINIDYFTCTLLIKPETALSMTATPSYVCISSCRFLTTRLFWTSQF